MLCGFLKVSVVFLSYACLIMKWKRRGIVRHEQRFMTSLQKNSCFSLSVDSGMSGQRKDKINFIEDFVTTCKTRLRRL